jgi:excisionase family DNA binding protein
MMRNTEQFLTLKQAALELGLPYHQLQRATRRGLIPSYKPFGKRPLVRIAEVTAFIEAYRVEASQ